MLVVRETTIHEFPDPQVVINAKDVQGARRFDLRQWAPTGSIVDLDTAGMPLRHVIGGRTIHIKTGFVDL
jgi:hypothetical protein